MKKKEQNEPNILLVERHTSGDWGDMSSSDKALNERALTDGGRIFSAYRILDGAALIFVLTEADRRTTTVMVSDEY